ncbi:M4 family metallopeptidase [Aquimarina pacifica]|uniref:M4 family metallopeptidase n=1 Tax=Aquimarina pacifica TaxID=1296415 RepID=UPI00046E9798|nr:M4 family metallopeptidase [Aquimarina pacifica]
MKKSYKRLSLLAGLGLSCFFAIAQEKNQKKSENFLQPPGLIILDKVASQTKSSQDILKQNLNLSEGNTYSQIKQRVDQLGFTHAKHQQYYNGIKVEFGEATISSKNGIPRTLQSKAFDVRNLKTAPLLSEAQALQKALAHVGATKYIWDTPQDAKLMNYSQKAALVILPNLQNPSEASLTYKFDIYALSPVSRSYIYVNAETGAIELENAIIKHLGAHSNSSKHLKTVPLDNDCSTENTMYLPFASGSAATRYSGTQTITTRIVGSTYALRDNTRGNGINTYNSGTSTGYPSTNFTDNDNIWTAEEFDNSAKDNAALDAHWGAEQTYDYWQSVHNRNSFNGSGAAINSWVHYDDNYDNAFWNGSVMTYGDGSSNGNEGNGNFDALTSLDVAAHEIGHAVTTNTANLVYRYESGALNEGFSDIWGAAVEYYAKGNGNFSDAVWLIGDEIDRRSGSAALRSMSDPKSLGYPDTYQGTNWNGGSSDNGGVHTNSSVLNHWFYLVTVGSSTTDGINDNGDSFSVTGIGINKAELIAFRTLDVYLTSSSDFDDARASAIQSTIDLYGAGGTEEIAVTNAWYAVGVGDEYGGGGSGDSYCTSEGNSVADEYISNVSIGTINNSSSASSGYTDYTSISTNLGKEETYSITITPTWTGTVYSEGYAVWIDYNQNNSFDDAGELVWSNAASQSTSVSGSFTISSSAIDGETRMRVSMKYNGIPSSCETFNYGEVEDYTVIIGNSDGGGTDTQNPTAPTGLVASNITDTSITLSWDASSDNVGVIGYDIYQDSSLLGETSNTTATINSLSSGTTYQFSVKAKDAAGNESNSSSSISVTTEDEDGGVDICDGIEEWDSSASYSVGDKVTYNGNLYERTFFGWTNLGPCDAAFSFTGSTTTYTKAPPVGNLRITEFRVYPVPLSGSELSVESSETRIQTYTIFNMLGQVMDKGTFTNTINVEKLNNGSYFLKVGTDVKPFIIKN